MKKDIICIIASLIGLTVISTSADEGEGVDSITPELKMKIHRPYPAEPHRKKYCDVWVTARQLLPMKGAKPKIEINEFKSPSGLESEVKQEALDAMLAHKVTRNLYILAKVQETEVVEYRYTYFKHCDWNSDESKRSDKSVNR